MNKFIVFFLAVILIIFSYFFTRVEVHDNIEQYNNFIGNQAKEKYKNKWNMDESIFPKEITENMNVKDYKMVYYNPWDAQYLSYLVVNYDNEAYQEEVERLKKYNSSEYIGYYGVTGFSKYKLLAIYVDSYYGFVYALANNENEIIYVELIFCNGFYDLKYENYINTDYLPDGFNAKWKG